MSGGRTVGKGPSVPPLNDRSSILPRASRSLPAVVEASVAEGTVSVFSGWTGYGGSIWAATTTGACGSGSDATGSGT